MMLAEPFVRGFYRALLVLMVALHPCVAAAPARLSTESALQRGEDAAPWVALRQAHRIEGLVSAAPGSGRALAAGDFDGDGLDDLIVGLAQDGGGRVLLLRGNRDLLHPHTPTAVERARLGRASDAPFDALLASRALALVPDFLAVGDFDADGHLDVVVAERGADRLLWLRGDGRGGLAPPRSVSLPGVFRAGVAGEINRRDGLEDLALALDGPDGALLAIFESPDGALSVAPEVFSLPRTATALAFARLQGEAYIDLITALGSGLWVLRGRDRRLSHDSLGRAGTDAPRAAFVDLGFDIDALAAGDFLGDPDHAVDVAVAGADGSLRVLRGSDLRAALMAENARLDESQLTLLARAAPAPRRTLVAGRNASLPVDTPLLLDPGARHAEVWIADPLGRHPQPVAARYEGAALVAAQSLHLDRDAIADLVLLDEDGALIVLGSDGGCSFTVNDARWIGDPNLGDGKCDVDLTTPEEECTLLAAFQNAERFDDPDIICFGFESFPVVIGQTSQVQLQRPVFVDGASQPGFAGEPVIEFRGASTPANVVFSFFGGNSGMRAIVRNRGPVTSIGAGGNRFLGNWIGLENDGATAAGGSLNLSTETLVQGNVIAGNPTGNGIGFGTGNPAGTVLRGNLIGTDKTGTLAVPNSIGINLSSTAHLVTIGGPGAGHGNVVAASLQFGIVVASNDVLIQGNRIGTDASGAAPLGNGLGVNVTGNARRLALGGTGATSGNLISGNVERGVAIFVFGGLPDVTLVQGNRIGSDAAGSGALGNGGTGIDIGNQSGPVLIGGASAGAGNLIVANGNRGILTASDGAMVGAIQGNHVGIANGLPVPNVGHAVHLFGTRVRVGGSDPGTANTIYHQGGSGVVPAGGGNPFPILGNAIFDDFSAPGLAIDWRDNGVSPNDNCDSSTGANDIPNFPILIGGGAGSVGFTLNARANTQYRIEFFSVARCDPSGHGEARDFLGATSVATDATCNAAGTYTGPIGNGLLTATATRFVDGVPGMTSELSACQRVQTAFAPVNTTGDLPDLVPGNGVCDTGQVVLRNGVPEAECTLRAAIVEANASAGAQTILFDVIGADADEPRIQPASPLPALTDSAFVDGESQPGAGRVFLDTSLLPAGSDGLRLSAGSGGVRGMRIGGTPHAALRFDGGSGHLAMRNILGRDASGLSAANRTGLLVEQVPDVQIRDNTVAGNEREGIVVRGAAAGGAQVLGNWIGTDALLTPGLGNLDIGVEIDQAPSAVVADNVVVANGIGIFVTGVGASGNLLVNNHIGIDRSRQIVLGNSAEGIFINQAPNNLVIGNVVVANAFDGIAVVGPAASGNLLLGNRVGSDEGGSPGLGNGENGILILNAPLTEVRGNESNPCVISGNGTQAGGDGIRITGSQAGAIVTGCRIGTTPDGLSALGNQRHGVAVTGAGSSTIGELFGLGNLISGNLGHGILLAGDPTGEITAHAVENNQIGSNATATAALPNFGDGIAIENSGGHLLLLNLIGGNFGSGVRLEGSDFVDVLANLIGVGFANTPLGNGDFGVLADNASNHVIGSIAFPNSIAHNGLDGVRIAGGARNAIRGNTIFANGRLGIDLVGGDEDAFGVTANDPDDADTGSNQLQNYPVIVAASDDGAFFHSFQIELQSTPGQTFEIDYFDTVACDPSGHGEGRIWRGSLGLVMPPGGVARRSLVLPTLFPPVLTLTATDGLGNTSEFSACLIAQAIAPELVINEVDAVAEATVQFVELFHRGGALSLTGHVLVLYEGGDAGSYAAIDLAGHATNAEGYFVIGAADAPNVDLVVDDGLLRAGPAAVALHLGQPSDFPEGTPPSTVGLLDALVYGAPPEDQALLVLLEPDQPQRDEGEAGSAAAHSLQRCPNGAGGRRITELHAAALPTAGEANACVVCTLSPFAAADAGEATHGVTAQVQADRLLPLAEVAVDFVILAGPNAGVAGQAETDTLGLASFAYPRGASGGIDQIEARGEVDGQPFSCRATRVWQSDLVFANGFEPLPTP